MCKTNSTIILCLALFATTIAKNATSPKECYASTIIMTEANKVNKCFKDMFEAKAAINKPDLLCKNFNDFNNEYSNFRKHVLNDCNKIENSSILNENRTFLDMVKFVVEHENIKEYMKSGKIQCLKTNLNNLKNCNTHILNYTNIAEEYISKTHLHLQTPQCDEMLSSQICTLPIINMECGPEMANFMGSLYEIALKSCKEESNGATYISSFSALFLTITAFTVMKQ